MSIFHHVLGYQFTEYRYKLRQHVAGFYPVALAAYRGRLRAKRRLLSQFEGASKDDSIFTINDTSVEKGLQFRITSRAGYYGPGKSGDDLFEDEDDFEEDVINSMTVAADFLRNATRSRNVLDEYMYAGRTLQRPGSWSSASGWVAKSPLVCS